MFGLKIKAPEFANLPVLYTNTEKFSLASLKGNVVLFDFWTYCCINCIHTIPDLAYLEAAFADAPFQVIGIHSFKFDNENDPKNVLNAIKRYEIHHPVLLDEQREVWDNYAIRAWPSLILIDAEGYIRKGYSGEGHRQELAHDIQNLLREGKEKGVLREKVSIPLTIKQEKPFLYFPAKLSIKDDTIAIANANRNNILIGTIQDTSITITDVIGNGKEGYADGNFSNASFYRPQGVLFQDNMLYVADTENNLIRAINLTTKTVETLPTPSISSPWDLAYKDQILYIALAGTHQIGKFDLTHNDFSIFAGNRYENIIDGPALHAALAQTSGLFIYKNNLYFADSETSSIRYVILQEPYIVHTIAGHGLFTFGVQDGTTQEALFQHPLGLSVYDDIIYVADTYNSAIRTINLTSDTVATLIAPKNNTVCMIDDKECNVLPLQEPADVKKYKSSLLISDTNNHLIRKFDLITKELTTMEIIEDYA